MYRLDTGTSVVYSIDLQTMSLNGGHESKILCELRYLHICDSVTKIHDNGQILSIVAMDITRPVSLDTYRS